MAEPNMNPNSPEQMMLVQSFEQMANAVGAEIPVNLSSEIAAVKAGKRMSGELQRMSAEGSMSLMNQLNPEMMPETEKSYEVDGRMERMSPEMMDNMVTSGQISQGEARIKTEDEDPYSRLMRMIRSGQITIEEARLALDTAGPADVNSEEMRRFMDMKSAAQEKMGMPGPGMMPSQDEMTYGPSSGITVEPNVMTLEEAVDAGLVTPTRPRMRPAAPATSMRPQARPMR